MSNVGKFLVGIGLLGYLISFTIPALIEPGKEPMLGWDAAMSALVWGDIYGKTSAASNALVLLLLVYCFSISAQIRQPIGASLALVGLYNCGWFFMGLTSRDTLGAGYYLWCVSFGLMGMGMIADSQDNTEEVEKHDRSAP